MQVIHLNSFDSGGAAIAAFRHSEAMTRAGIDSKLLIRSKTSNGKTALAPFEAGWKIIIALFGRKTRSIQRKVSPVGSFSIMCYGLPYFRLNEVRNADVIVLHWVNGDMLSVRGVEKILKLGKPTYWFMHDMFAITGGCHHSMECDGYMKNCINCPMIMSKRQKNIAHRQLCKKIRKWGKYENFHFIAPSKWLYECISKSQLAKGHKIYLFPNVVDTSVFCPQKIECKALFGLDPHKKTILFCAAGKSLYKGQEFINECFEKLNPDKYEGLVMGDFDNREYDNMHIKVIPTGFLSDSLSVVVSYNSCDVLVIPSIAENYPNVVLECMACGKPCVGFNIGGIPDLIKHGISGYLVQEMSSTALLAGVEYVCSNEQTYRKMSFEARRQIERYNSYSHNLSQIFE